MALAGYLKNCFLKLGNMCVLSEKNSIFAYPITNCKIDNYDIINYTADTTLTFLNYWMQHPDGEKHKIYLVIFHPEKIEKYKQYVAKCQHLQFVFLKHPSCCKGIQKVIANFKIHIARYKSTLWLFEMIPSIRSYALKCQKQLCLGYFASCKSDYGYKSDFKDFLHTFSIEDQVVISSTSLVDSAIKAAAYGVPFQCFRPFGLTRNDLLCQKRNEDKVMNWLRAKGNTFYSGIVLYAPTFRDYEDRKDIKKRSIWGREYDDEKINQFLLQNNILVITKLHPWQNPKVLNSINGNIIAYEANVEFSFYDLMTVADVMITDYSSIGLDWLLMDKPLIYNLYDLDEYKEKRGVAYEPYEDICGGLIVKNTDELIMAIQQSLRENGFMEKQQRIKNMMFKEQNFQTNALIYEYIHK